MVPPVSRLPFMMTSRDMGHAPCGHDLRSRWLHTANSREVGRSRRRLPPRTGRPQRATHMNDAMGEPIRADTVSSSRSARGIESVAARRRGDDCRVKQYIRHTHTHTRARTYPESKIETQSRRHAHVLPPYSHRPWSAACTATRQTTAALASVAPQRPRTLQMGTPKKYAEPNDDNHGSRTHPRSQSR